MGKILVIDDDAAIRSNIAELLGAEGHEVTVAANGAIGVRLASSGSPDLVVCDVGMPELDGHGVLRALRAKPTTRDIPFIFLTAKSERADIRAGMNLGADDYLTKPFSRVELLEAISARLARRGVAQPAPKKAGPAALTLGPGDVFDRYRIEASVGSGGMGIVFRAHDSKLDRLVALKVLQPKQIYLAPSLEKASAQLVAEARAAAKLSHPHVIAIYDVGSVDDVPFLAMEFVVGATLRAKARAPWQQKLEWLVEVADALSAAHRAGLIHRDVKPENVMVRADGRALVLDFGIARFMQGDSATVSSGGGKSLVKGTPFYMSPEQLFGEPVDARSDQFAWAVMAYELFAGELPWGDSDGAIAVVKAITQTDAPPLAPLAPELPASVVRVVERALAKAPDDRFPSMEAVLAELAPNRASRASYTSEALPAATGAASPVAPTDPAVVPTRSDVELADTEPVVVTPLEPQVVRPARTWLLVVVAAALVVVAAACFLALR